ncbi:Meteorin-like protein [Ooceraea biroi]|nr:Meteorin-like protein [Ooceraea biroi]
MRLYSPFDGKHELSHRCFRSRKHVTALFMEAEDNNSFKNIQVKLQYNLEPTSLKGGVLHIPDEEEECRPCTTEELAKAYCESDLVARGTLTAVQQQYVDTEAAELTFRITRVLRQVAQETEGNETVDVATLKSVRVRVPAVCDARHGRGEFAIMAKRRFEDFVLVCAPRLEEWAQAVREMSSAPCVLNS